MEKNMSPQESLLLIQGMISRTKNNLSENRFYFLFWGWVTFAALLLQFVLKVLVGYAHHYMVWLLMIPAAIITIMYSSRKEDKRSVVTYVGASMAYLWTGIGISFFILSLIISYTTGWLHAFPFFILFYGLGTFVSGRILQFSPLVIGGILNWILAIACLFATYDFQLLITAAAILSSYIIPGHLLTTENK